MERKHLQLFLAGTLLLAACEQEVHAMAVPTKESDPKVLAPAQLPDFVPTPTTTPTEIPTVEQFIPTQEIAPIAIDCVMPFANAKWQTGLMFTDVIESLGNGVKTHHLGVDFKEAEGTPVVSICDGTLMYAGEAFQGTGRNLGNIVVIKYDYWEQNELKTIYGLYGHMRNIIQNTEPGTVIKKGEYLGEVSHSGGWPADHNHLHFELISPRGKSDLEEFGKNNYGENAHKFWSYYPEEWPIGQIRRDFVDPQIWLNSRLQK